MDLLENFKYLAGILKILCKWMFIITINKQKSFIITINKQKSLLQAI